MQTNQDMPVSVASSAEQALRCAMELLHGEMERFDKVLMKTLKTQKRYLTKNSMEVYKRGKRFRPMLLLLSAKLNSKSDHEPLPEKVIKAAVSLEMLHVGSLIQDDIVDKAPLRRGLPSLYQERGHEEAMLVGDMQMIESMRSFVGVVKTQQDLKLVRHYLDTAFNLVRGEIDEMQRKPSWQTDMLRRRYLRTIDRKTGKLISLACEAGARLVKARVGLITSMEKYGMYCGRAFQVMDDLKDIYQKDHVSGKQQFIDLRNARISLPYIYVMDTLPRANPVKKILSGKKYSETEFKQATRLVIQSRGIDKAYSEARVYMLKAVEHLEVYGDNKYAVCLRNLVETVVNN